MGGTGPERNVALLRVRKPSGRSRLHREERLRLLRTRRSHPRAERESRFDDGLAVVLCGIGMEAAGGRGCLREARSGRVFPSRVALVLRGRCACKAVAYEV